jgi:uncharacterized protein involved in outer membrane biogenesis
MKAFLSTLAGLVLVIVLAAVVIGFIFWSRIPDMIASSVSKKLKVPVEIEGFGLNTSKIDMKKIQIGNPPGSILNRAFACDEVDILAPLTRYLDKRIIIDEIDLKNVYLGLEFDSANGTSGNWTKIMSNLEHSSGQPPQKQSKRKKSKEAQQAPPAESTGRSLLIHKIVLTNIDVDVVYRKERSKVKRLPRIPRMELTEISSEGGVPSDQILNSVLGEMLKQVFIKENLKNMMQDLIDTPSPIQPYIAPFKGLFNVIPGEIDLNTGT